MLPVTVSRRMCMWRTTEGYQVALQGRPQRDSVIDNDDLVSLRIDLETLSTDAFIAKHCETEHFADLPLRITYRRRD